MKIYTKTGDKGKTTLIGGKVVRKNHIRIEAYGSIDELMAHVAMLSDMIEEPELRKYLYQIQDSLMICAAILAADCDDCGSKIPDLPESDIMQLEKEIDKMDISLPPLKSFILPGGHIVSSQCHIARTVCRRAERQIITLSGELFVPDTVIKFINRLSDFLFVLARKVLHNSGQKETLWKPKL